MNIVLTATNNNMCDVWWYSTLGCILRPAFIIPRLSRFIYKLSVGERLWLVYADDWTVQCTCIQRTDCFETSFFYLL